MSLFPEVIIRTEKRPLPAACIRLSDRKNSSEIAASACAAFSKQLK